MNNIAPQDAALFAEQMERLRRGDPDAIRQFVDEYAPFLRRSLRYRIHNASLQSAADSVDICQSVFGGFLLRLCAGDYVIDSKENLLKLLVSIANKKFVSFQRRERRQRRDRYRTESLHSSTNAKDLEIMSDCASIDNAELFREVRLRLTQHENQLLEMRSQSKSWREIADELCESEVVLRQRLSRALHRVSQELGLCDDSHE